MKRYLPPARGIVAALFASTALLAGARAHADPCYDAMLRPNLVYVAGSSAVKGFLSVVAGLLAAEDPAYTIVYQSQGSCTGVSAIFSTDAAGRSLADDPAKPIVFFNPDGSTEECTVGPTGALVDVGVSDVFSSTCDGITQPVGVEIRDFEGPIQPMTFVVPAASPEQNISAEAGYLALGLGGYNGRSAPWIDPQYFYVRNASSGTQQMIARAVDVPASKWWGVDQGGSGAVRDGLKAITDTATASKALGILSTDVVDAVRDELKILAFQAMGQSCAFWPDSTPFSFDKQNVRDGHYLIWGPVHFYARVEQDNLPNAAARALVNRFSKPSLDESLLEAVILQHLVPKCAMKVQRLSEMGPLESYETPYRCDCFFESIAEQKTSEACQPCSLSSECPAERPACNYGFCEEGT